MVMRTLKRVPIALIPITSLVAFPPLERVVAFCGAFALLAANAVGRALRLEPILANKVAVQHAAAGALRRRRPPARTGPA